jgi:cold-inducible RNA-binding protein
MVAHTFGGDNLERPGRRVRRPIDARSRHIAPGQDPLDEPFVAVARGPCYFVGAKVGLGRMFRLASTARPKHEGVVSVRLFIGNLPYSATEPDLREHLSSVGAPAQIVLPTDRETGRPRGFAFVDYAEREVAEEAIRRFNQQPFKGRPLAVSEARPREDRPPGAGPRPGGFSSPRPGGAPPGFSSPRPGGYSPRPSEGGGGPPGSRSRNFGPDAPPKNKRKPPRKDSDRGPKGPIKERPVGRLYDNDEDWRAKDEPEAEVDNVATSAKKDEMEEDET